MKIIMETIPKDEMRFKEEAEDWYYDPDGTWRIKVAPEPTDTWKEQFLIAIHGLIEMALCKAHGISQEEVDKFDLWFEEQKLEGQPGSHKDSPYFDEHTFAGSIERLLYEPLEVEPRKLFSI